MVFAVSEGQIVSIDKPSYQAPTSLRINEHVNETYARIYETQPSVRTVVDFLGRNIAQLSLQTFERVGENDRKRLRDHPLAILLNHPNSFTTPYRLMRDLVSDLGIYDFALWVKTHGEKSELTRIHPQMVEIVGDNWMQPSGFKVTGSNGSVTLKPETVVYFRGYNPQDGRQGLSPIETLRRALSEEWAAGQMREQVLRNGARTSGYLERPATTVPWSDAARKRFASGWRGQYAGATATEAGGTPILEDGMKFVSASQSAVDLQYIESRKLTREEVAAAYFIPPPMVGIMESATFSNITEQHKMLYQDTLGPRLMEIKQEIELQLLPEFDTTGNVYVEFNMNEKMRGSFEEQASQLQTSVGAPYMTRNEARARANLPSVDGGDELITPLNVLVGGQASPTDSAPDGALAGPRPQSKSVLVKSRPSKTQVDTVTGVLSKFFARQEQAIRSTLGAKKADEWWNEKRWNDELSAELFAASTRITKSVARKQLDGLGVDPDDYDEDRTLEYQTVVAANTASSINAVTKFSLDDAMSDDDPLESVGHVFDVAKSSRADQSGLTLATSLAGFASVEAVTQVKGTRTATKSWVVTSGNPRPSHAQMAGETVPIDSTFSNGAKWPADSSALDVDEVAGCSCDVEINIE